MEHSLVVAHTSQWRVQVTLVPWLRDVTGQVDCTARRAGQNTTARAHCGWCNTCLYTAMWRVFCL